MVFVRDKASVIVMATLALYNLLRFTQGMDIP